MHEIFNPEPKTIFFNLFVYSKLFDEFIASDLRKLILKNKFDKHILAFKSFIIDYYHQIHEMLDFPDDPCKHYLTKVYSEYKVNLKSWEIRFKLKSLVFNFEDLKAKKMDLWIFYESGLIDLGKFNHFLFLHSQLLHLWNQMKVEVNFLENFKFNIRNIKYENSSLKATSENIESAKKHSKFDSESLFSEKIILGKRSYF